MDEMVHGMEEAHMNGFYATAEVCRLLGVKEHNVNQQIRANKIQAPELFRGRRLWKKADIIRLAVCMGVKPPSELVATRRNAGGLPASVETR